MRGVIKSSILNGLVNFMDDGKVKHKARIVKKIINLTKEDNNLRFIKEIIDLTKREKTKKWNRKKQNVKKKIDVYMQNRQIN